MKFGVIGGKGGDLADDPLAKARAAAVEKQEEVVKRVLAIATGRAPRNAMAQLAAARLILELAAGATDEAAEQPAPAAAAEPEQVERALRLIDRAQAEEEASKRRGRRTG